MTMPDLIDDLHQDEFDVIRADFRARKAARRRDKLVEFGVALAIVAVAVAGAFLWVVLR